MTLFAYKNCTTSAGADVKVPEVAQVKIPRSQIYVIAILRIKENQK